MHCLRSVYKGTDQLCSYRAADLRLCFRICKKTGFYDEAHHICFPCRLTKAEKEQHAAVVEKTVLEQKYRGEVETAKVDGEKQLGGGGVVFKALLP